MLNFHLSLQLSTEQGLKDPMLAFLLVAHCEPQEMIICSLSSQALRVGLILRAATLT